MILHVIKLILSALFLSLIANGISFLLITILFINVILLIIIIVFLITLSIRKTFFHNKKVPSIYFKPWGNNRTILKRVISYQLHFVHDCNLICSFLHHNLKYFSKPNLLLYQKLLAYLENTTQ